ncbi:MAG: DUF4369 domain-containing protein [Dysgonamonadaceae bacterium]|jgi:hypothetical protein|nr:DUF4369 domain-containing protein [Dysgonamonadaceae bacterium]
MKNNKIIDLRRFSIRLFSYSVILLFAACTNRGTIIEGTLPSDKYDQQMVYWVPFEGEHPRPVDSVLIQGNTFHIVISPHNYNKMGIVRLGFRQRLGLQDLLVFTDPGTVQVKIDSISSATGTPLNDVMQKWKDRKQIYDQDAYALRLKFRDAELINVQDSLKAIFEDISAAYHNDVYQIVSKNKDNEVGKFIYSFHKSAFTPEQINELKMDELSIEKD